MFAMLLAKVRDQVMLLLQQRNTITDLGYALHKIKLQGLDVTPPNISIKVSHP
jgi:hypothetical protein